MHFIDIVGAAGMLLVLFAFYRTSVGRWTGKSFWYELDNLVGAILMSFYAYEKHAYVSIALNIVWAIVAFRGISTYAERRMKRDFKKFAKMTKKQRRRFTN